MRLSLQELASYQLVVVKKNAHWWAACDVDDIRLNWWHLMHSLKRLCQVFCAFLIAFSFIISPLRMLGVASKSPIILYRAMNRSLLCYGLHKLKTRYILDESVEKLQ